MPSPEHFISSKDPRFFNAVHPKRRPRSRSHLRIDRELSPLHLLGGKGLCRSHGLEISFVSLRVYWEPVLVSAWAAVGSVLSASSPQFGAAGYFA